MSDLISRKTVLEALADIQAEVEDGDGFQYDKWKDYFTDLPSCGGDTVSCSDLISRQAARDALLRTSFMAAEDRAIAVEAVETVPSITSNVLESLDCVSRQAAIDAICKACSMEEDYHKCDGYPETSTWCDELVALRALPSAQPERKKGRWIKLGMDDPWYFACSECRWKDDTEFNFCPNCGAEMGDGNDS